MPFVFTKISNYGAAHPIVARLSIQTSELIKWSTLNEDERKRVIIIYHDNLQARLLRCCEILGRLEAARDKTLSEFETQIQSDDPRTRSFPHIIGLQQECENFLYEVKNYLRDFLGVAEVFFGISLPEASQIFRTPKGKGGDNLISWSTREFGSDDELTALLQSDRPWIERLVYMRNSIEHPNGPFGPLFINNYEYRSDGMIAPPVWYKEGDDPTDVFLDMESTIENLLLFAEDLLVVFIKKRLSFKQIVFIQIAEEDRRKECPQRLTVQLSPELRSPPPEPAAPQNNG